MESVDRVFPWGVYVGDLVDENETIPLLVDSSHGGFCLLFDDSSQKMAVNFVENIALKLIDVMALGSLKVDIFDFGKKRFLYLSSLEKAEIYTIAFNQNRATSLFDTIEDDTRNRDHNLLDFEIKTLSEYNQKSEAKESFHLVLINIEDFPDEMMSAKRIRNFLESAFASGFYVIAFGNKSLKSSKAKATQELLKLLPTVEINNNKFNFSKEVFELEDMIKSYEFEYLDLNKTALTKEILSRQAQKEQQSDIQNFLKVPIGKKGAERVYFELGLKSAVYSAFVAGMTGAGKSNLLNVIITSIAQNYTAKEIELYMMDYNEGGLEFNKYKNHPNCKKLFLNCRNPKQALDMLNEFNDIMAQRANIIANANQSNINDYNKKNPNSKLSYKILIIDEVQEMFSGSFKEVQEFNTALKSLAKRGRKYGLHFILATQGLDGINIDKSIISQIGARISFRLSSPMDGMKIFPDNKEAYNKVATLPNYSFLYQSGINTTIAKADYLPQEKIEDILNNTREQRAKDEILTPIIYDNNDIEVVVEEQIQKSKTTTEYKPKYNTDSYKELLAKLDSKKGESDE